MARNKTILSFSIDAELAQKLENLADAQGKSRSALVEQFIREAIDQEAIAIKAIANPVVRDALVKMFTSPQVFMEMGKAFGDPATAEQVEKLHRNLPDVLGLAGEILGGKKSNRRLKKRKVAVPKIKRGKKK